MENFTPDPQEEAMARFLSKQVAPKTCRACKKPIDWQAGLLGLCMRCSTSRVQDWALTPKEDEPKGDW